MVHVYRTRGVIGRCVGTPGASCTLGYGKLATMDSSPSPATPSQPIKGWPVFKEVGADMVGMVIAGRHKIVRRLAKGGMADVFLAKDMTRKCRVAIKILRSRSPESRRRFKVEGQVLSNLQHAGIVRAVDLGETEDGQPFMALEYLEGETLAARLARGPLPWREVATLGIQVAAAVHALHVAGIIHRDLKPDNIMVTTGDDRTTAKVIDLGLASVGAPYQDVQDAYFTPDPPMRHPTQLGHPIGTPPYLPPEAGLCSADSRLDVYSLGVTLYQLCTRLLPAAGGRPLREVCPGSDAPDDLSRLLLAALAVDPNERLPSADHLRRGLEAILDAHPRVQGPRHLLGGSYDRLEVLGVGASAVVFRASDRWLSRDVAIKVLRDAEPSEDDAIRFRRAAKVLSALHHPNIPRILHFGSQGGQFFAVTELCTGSPATAYVRPDHHLRPDEVLAVGLQLAGALAAVHATGVVYRDLHPGNVLIARGETPRAWIFDFDQAQVSPEFYAALTERWATPPEERAEPKRDKPLQAMDYAAPEVRGGAAFSAASDVYALGLLLYRLLTGRRPFPVAGGEPTPPRKFCPACPRGLESLLLAMLRPNHDQRPALARISTTLEDEQAELAADLAERELEDVESENAEPPVAAEQSAVIAIAEAAAVTAAPEAGFVSATEEAMPTTKAHVGPASRDPQEAGEPGQGRSSRRATSLLALGLTAVVSLAIGRATVSHEGIPELATEVPPEAKRGDDRPHHRAADERPPALSDAAATLENVAPLTHEAPAAAVLPPAPAESKEGGAASDAVTKPATARRDAVTIAEATTAVTRALPRLRECKDIPRRVTADLDIVRGHGVVTEINQHEPTPGDPRYPWHACVKKELEGVRFPASTTASHVQVRLTIR